MSIRQTQIKNILELISQAFFVSGINPLTSQMTEYLNVYFSKNPPGNPLTYYGEYANDVGIADYEKINQIMARCVVNLDTLYETADDQIEDMMMLTSVLRTHLERLRMKRRILEGKIDDYLLGIFNSDGYFYSFSDTFINTNFIDFNLTNAFIDFESGTVSLPSVNSGSVKVDLQNLTQPQVIVRGSEDQALTYQVKTNFENATDGLTNTAWYLEVRTTDVGPVVAEVTFTFSRLAQTTRINKLEIRPYGVTPVQCAVKASYLLDDASAIDVRAFSDYIKKSTDKMVFVSNRSDADISSITLQLSKTEADYEISDSNVRSKVYIFGFKEILATEQAFDTSATFVTTPVGIDSSFKDEAVIDAVSLTTESIIPAGTAVQYYIAPNISGATALSDFDWKEIKPLEALDSSGAKVIHFNGSVSDRKMIRLSPRSSNDIRMIAADTLNTDLSKRNPSPSIITGLDVYRLCEFKDAFLSNTLALEEGINSTRIFYTDLDEDALNFAFWKDKFDDPTSYFTSYGEIDSGHDFFYGGDIGEDSKSVYVETFIHCDKEFPVFLKECRKADVNARSWDVKMFLNGKEIANMPIGTDKLTVPWKLMPGKNHLVLMANIPEATQNTPVPYIGTMVMMADAKLNDFGIVKLGDWTYIDFENFKNNKVNNPEAFTIYHDEIISRRKPTNNFRISFKNSTAVSPEAVRLRIDMARTERDLKATPIIDSYRIRFSYAD